MSVNYIEKWFQRAFIMASITIALIWYEDQIMTFYFCLYPLIAMWYCRNDDNWKLLHMCCYYWYTSLHFKLFCINSSRTMFCVPILAEYSIQGFKLIFENIVEFKYSYLNRIDVIIDKELKYDDTLNNYHISYL